MHEIHVFPDLEQDRARIPRPVGEVLHSLAAWNVIGIPEGTASGKASVMFTAPVKVGKHQATVVLETTLQLFMNAATILASRYRSQLDVPGFAKPSPAVRGLIKSRIFDRILPALGNDMTVADNIAELVMLALSDDTGQEAPPS